VPSDFAIGQRHIGPGAPLFVIAEIGLTFEDSIDRGVALGDAAAAAGASAINLQTAPRDDLVKNRAGEAGHDAACSVMSYHAPYRLDGAAQRAIAAHAHTRNLEVIATPSSHQTLELLESCAIDAYKIASRDLTYLGLIDNCSRTGKPVLLSTGLATPPEIAHAVWSARRAGARHLALLHCVSAHAVPPDSENLRALATLAQAFGVPVGLSDHGRSRASVAIAVTLGATLYERHFRLERDAFSSTGGVSSTGVELADAIRMGHETRAALGHGRKEPLAVETGNLLSNRRSLRATRRLAAGHVVVADDIAVLRPGTGLPPDREADLVGVRLGRSIEAGAPFLECDVSARDVARLRVVREAAGERPLAEAV
jgi:N,N'-diacetyllegionaminate synthase